MGKLTIEWCRPEELTSDEIFKAASWIRLLDVEFYGLFQLNESKVFELIAQLFFQPLSELSPTLLVRHMGSLAGLITWFPSDEMFVRRIFVLKQLLAATANIDNIKEKLRSFEGASRKVPRDALYLSKIYVADANRGYGLGGRLLCRFLEESRVLVRNSILHVKHDNYAAVALYEKYGFVKIDSNDKNCYCLMESRLHF